MFGLIETGKNYSLNLYRLFPLSGSRNTIDTYFKKVDMMKAVNTLAGVKK